MKERIDSSWRERRGGDNCRERVDNNDIEGAGDGGGVNKWKWEEIHHDIERLLHLVNELEDEERREIKIIFNEIIERLRATTGEEIEERDPLNRVKEMEDGKIRKA